MAIFSLIAKRWSVAMEGIFSLCQFVYGNADKTAFIQLLFSTPVVGCRTGS